MEKSYGRGPFDTQPRVLCGPCNSAWMTKYEDVAGPLLARMISASDNLTVSDVEARAVAVWAVAASLIRSTADDSIPRLSPELMRKFREHGPEAIGARVAVLSFANNRALFHGHAVGSTYISDAEEPGQSALGLLFLRTIVVVVGFGKFARRVELAGHVFNPAVVCSWPTGGPNQGWPTRAALLDSALMLGVGITDYPRSASVPATPIRWSSGSKRSVIRVPQAFTSAEVTSDRGLISSIEVFREIIATELGRDEVNVNHEDL